MWSLENEEDSVKQKEGLALERLMLVFKPIPLGPTVKLRPRASTGPGRRAMR